MSSLPFFLNMAMSGQIEVVQAGKQGGNMIFPTLLISRYCVDVLTM